MANPADAKYAEMCGRFQAPTVLRLTDASNALSNALSGKYYVLRSTIDCYYHQHNGTSDVTATNGMMLGASDTEWIPAGTEEGTNIAAITDGGDGYLYIQQKAP